MKKHGLFEDKKKTMNMLKGKYEKYNEYIYESFFDECYYDFKKKYDMCEGIKPEICFSLFLKNRVTKLICENIKKDNIDLEIDMIDQYIYILNMLIKKLNLREECIDNELVIMNAIETYDGSNLFSIHLLNTLKNNNNNNNKSNVEIKENNKVLKLK